MRFLSLFSGIEAASVAWEPLGWKCVGVSEISPFPCAVLAERFPHVPNLGDITKITDDRIKSLGKIDLIVGGFPCQDLSIAGNRAGLTDDKGEVTRSGLFYEMNRIISVAKQHCGLRWFVLENVPGMLSSKKGADFAAILSELSGEEIEAQKWKNAGSVTGGNGWNIAWRVLDAQFFGVAQRRRRVFIIGDCGGNGASKILLEQEGLPWSNSPRRKPTQNHQTRIIGPTESSYLRLNDRKFATLSACGAGARGVGGKGAELDFYVIGFTTKDYGSDATVNLSPTLRSMNAKSGRNNGGGQIGFAGPHLAPRRATPRECERLQAFPDDFTLVQFKGKPAVDGHRYAALGNTMCVNVMKSIGMGINQLVKNEAINDLQAAV